MYGEAAINKALNLASIRFLDPIYRNREKILLIISDGEFAVNSPHKYANLLKDDYLKVDTLLYVDALKKMGVTVVIGYVTNQTILTKMVPKLTSDAPQGAKLLFEAASTFEEGSDITNRIKQINVTPNQDKLFYQLNRGNMLSELLRAVTDSDDVP